MRKYNKHSSRLLAIRILSNNWRLRKRLPRLTKLGIKLGFFDDRNVNYRDM